MTNKAVVLAAGRGGRLERRTDRHAKGLVQVAGRPLIHYVLTALAQAGVREVVLVVGYHGEQLQADLGDGRRFGLKLHYVWNQDHTLGNANSLWRALPLVKNEPFLLVMGDHLCDPSLLHTLLAGADGHSMLAIDRSVLDDEQTAEATKVALVDGQVVDISKQLERWDAFDTGFSYWAPGAFASVADTPQNGELAVLMARLARNGTGLEARDISGHFWMDIDTEDDLRQAERLLQANGHHLA